MKVASKKVFSEGVMSARPIDIRFMEHHELPAALEVERLARVEEDPDFGAVLPRWAWTEEDLYRLVREDDGVKTRVVIAEMQPDAQPGQWREGERSLVVGVMGYEL